MLVGCGGTQPPIAAVGEASSAVIGKDESLLYVSDPQAGYIYMVALPLGRLLERLTGLSSPSGDCVDQYENVFMDDSAEGQVRAYAHGARSAFRVLNDASWFPYACSVDPTTLLAGCGLA
jgi:hypothetical protein